MASRTNLRSAAFAGLIAVALVASGCSSSSDPDDWVAADETGKIEENFLRACTEAGEGNTDPVELAAYCGCSYDALREEYAEDFDGFVAVNRDLGNDPAAIPDNVRKIYEGCAATHLTP